MSTMTPVQSSQIAAIGFNESTGELLIQFRNKTGVGKTYSYTGPTAKQHYDTLLSPTTESVGSYFIRNVKVDPDLKYRALTSEIDQPVPLSNEALNARPDDNPTKVTGRPGELQSPGELKAPGEIPQLF